MFHHMKVKEQSKINRQIDKSDNAILNYVLKTAF